MKSRSCCSLLRVALLAVLLFAADAARGQVVITEIMHSPGGADALWEWIEIINTGATPVDLDGWVFDDDDDPTIAMPNIRAADGNTIVPAGGVAVLYPGDELEFEPARFNSAWGGGVTLIGVNGFTSLTSGDAIGLWPTHASYQADAIPMASNSPRRTFISAAAAFDYAAGFPDTEPSRSNAWNGSGSVTNIGNWPPSIDGASGARTSIETTRSETPINSVDDRGSPGTTPAGAASSGLLITEIMYDPRSSEPAWEWVEVYNNTGSLIDFGATPHVLDDDDEASLSVANVASGTVATGSTAVLFNAAANNLTDITAAWGADVNFIPVSKWSDLANGGDTIAIWNSLAAYENETQSGTSPRRTTDNAAAVVAYDDLNAIGWPNNDGNGSIFLGDLTSDPAMPSSWQLSNDDNSAIPQPVLQTVVDHPGGDVGSPGSAPGVVATLSGDFNDDNVVNAADYVLWRKAPSLYGGDPLGYDAWKKQFSQPSPGAGGGSAVPEPASQVMLVIGLVALYFRRRIIFT